MSQPSVRFSSRLLSYLVSALLVWQPLLPAIGAAIAPQGGATMDKAANGVPVVNITTPNGAGISHNQFKDYNVGKEGLILNNATGKLNQTQLGGLIQNNPNLRVGQEAKGIINEVTGGNRSQLNGYTEVAGKAANVMVANPYGITCNGCGFINTPQTTLTTGKPVFDANGNLQALDVKKGSITIEGQGIDASGGDALSIIARATEVNAAIHAKDLKVIAGANHVDHNGAVTPIAGEGNAPVVAVDTGALGGMYANRIHLMSTEKGVGVNLGDLNARQGDITLDASGKLTVHNSLTSGALSAKGGSLALTGDHKSSNSMSLNSQGDIILSNGTLNSDGDLVLTANGAISHTSEKLTAGRDATLTAKNISQDAASQINAARHIEAKASDTLKTQGQMIAGQNLTVSSNTLTQDGRLLAHNRAQLNAGTLNNRGFVQGASLSVGSSTLRNAGSLLSGSDLTVNTHNFTQSGSSGAKGKADITASGKLTNTGSLVSDDVLVLKAQDVAQNGVLSGGKGLTINVQTLTSGKNSVTHSDAAMTLNTRTVTLDGETSAGGDLQLQGDRLTTAASAQLQSGNNLSLSAREAALAGTQAALKNMTVNAREKLTHSGKSSAASLSLSAPELTNRGVLVASTLNTQSQTLTNSGLLQGASALLINTQKLDNQQNSTLYSAAKLTLDIPDIHNSGLIISDKGLTLSTDSLSNPGKIIADTLNVKATTLNGDGLLQGTGALMLAGDTLSQGSNGRWLTAGDLFLSGKTLNTAGTTQGQNLTAQAASWTNNGSLLATGNLNATLGASLLNNGDLMSQGDFGLNVPVLTNHGSILSSGELSLAGTTFTSDGSLQGNTLSLRQNSIDNRGAVIGLNGLTLNSTGRLTNSGDLLSQKSLTLNAGDVTNRGRLQGQNIALDGSSLTNSGAIQSALDLALTLSGDVIAATGSKITALGDARLTGKALSNQGLISAKTLEVEGDSLSNDGEISGVNGLSVTLHSGLQQQGKLLTGGKLALKAGNISNSGQLQGADTQLSASTLINSGRIQGDSALTLTLLNALTNQTNGVILSQDALSITAPSLTNDGTIQGNGKTTLSVATQARNDGKILSGGGLVFTTPDYSGSGLLQATNLVLNVAKFASSGTVLAANQTTLTGNSLTNSGTFQAAQLNVNAQFVNNGGTLLGNQGLSINASTINNENGKLFSGGDLLAETVSLSGAGQIVALGNLTLKLVNSWTSQGIVASNKQLSVSTRGDITNNATLQGDGITLDAAGKLTNNGQLTAGGGTTSLSGSQIAMNASGTLQAGGDVSLTSRGSIILDGFTGTAGNLLLNATGSIVNTALLYAGNNLALYANSIQNLHGDMLTGNNLVMQKDASGAANAEVINSSGSIETVNGDITINTADLLNTRDGLKVDTTYQEFMPTDQSQLNVSFASMGKENLGIASDSLCNGGNSGHCTTYYWLVPTFTSDEKTVLVNQRETTVTANGGAARIASGGNLTVNARTLTNESSYLLANGDISLSGQTLNNTSAEAGKWSTWEKFVWSCKPRCTTKYDPFPTGQTVEGWLKAMKKDKDSGIAYNLADSWTDYTSDNQQYRAVIQAGGNVSAHFTSNISNTDTTAHGGEISNTISAPDLNTPSMQNIGGSVGQQSLDEAGTLTITTPDWQSPEAGQSIGGGTNLAPGGMDGNYPLPPGNNGYFVPSTDPDSPYLITVNPKLDGLGQLDPSLFGDLYNLLGMNPGMAPRETGSQYTDISQFLGSSYMLGRLNLNPDKDYRFLGDAAFDTRYASNYVLNQTGQRYINGLGSDLDQMRYLMDNAASAQRSLGLTFGVALTAEQVAALDHSILWYETATINGQTVMVPKVYLSPKDVTVQSGSVISGNNVQLAGGNVTNSGSALLAQNGLTIDSSNSINNLNAGLIRAGGGLDLSALADINNIGSVISGKTVQLESTDGSINNITRTQLWSVGGDSRRESVHISGTDVGQTASISASDGLYMAAANDINITGAKVNAGGDLAMDAGNSINIAANQITDSSSRSGVWGQKNTSTSSTSNQGSSITAGGNAVMQAGNDLNVTASAINAGKTAQLVAENDLNLNAADSGQTSRTGGSESHQGSADRTTISAGDNVTLVAGRDVTSQAAGIAAEGNVGIQAGRDVNLLAEESVTGSSSHSKKKTVIDESVRQQGTEIASSGNTTIVAGRDVNAEAAQVTASGDIGVAAGRDVNLTTATESDYHYREETKTKKGFLSKKTTHTIEEDSATREAGTLLSGDSVTVQAGNNLLVKGSSVVGDNSVALDAGNNVDIVAATNTDTSWRFKEEKKSGLMGTGGIGISIGSSKTTHDLREAGTTQSQSFSTVGSTGGNVVIAAGNQAHIGGADLIAGKDMSLSGSSVIIDPGHDKRTRDETFEQKKSGLTLALSGTVGSAINNAVTAAQDTKEESDGRLKALQATKTVLSGVQAGQAADLTADPNAMGVSLSLTTQKSKSQQHAESDTITGSTLNAGNNLSITANGKGKGPNSGDIVIAGSQVKAGGDTLLDARHDVILSGAANTQQSSGKNSSSGGGVGVSIGAGKGAGISVFANVNAANGKDKGNGTDWTETTIDSGKTVTIKSGNDTVLNGAQVSGNKIVANVGHDLLMSSQQDSNKYDSKQSSVAAGGSFTFGSMTGSGYISASQDKMKSRFDSVAEQTGMFAGDGGFDITADNHTQLDGAVIASTATADKNSLDTGTLGFSDLHNEADFKTQHSGISISGAGSFGDQFKGNMPGGMIAAAGNSGHAEGTTQAAVADATITIRDKDNQKQDVANLSRDTKHANDSISPIFDKEKEQNRLKEIGMISDIGGQMADIARTQGELNALKAAQDKYGPVPADATEEQRQAYLAKLRDTPEYKKEQEKYGTGSDIQRDIQAATAALQGLAGGNLAGALAGASAPELAHLLKSTEDNPAVNAITHAILGGAVAALQGNSAAAGAIGAGGGELAARAIANMLYPNVDKLSEEQKQTVSALASISAGMAGGIATGNTAGAATGAGAGKNAVENNFLGATSSDKLDKAIEKIKNGDKSLATANELIKLENADKRSDALVSKFTKDPSQMSSTERAELAGYLRIYASEMEKTYGPAVAQQLVTGLLSGQDYMKRNPDSEAMSKAQRIMNTWGYHKSNASIGDAPLMFGSSVLGLTVKGMVANAAIGVGVNSAAQLAGKDPFSYVDAIMAGVTAAATTGKGVIISTPINMGGAAIGSSIKGEDPTNSVIGTGLGSVFGGGVGKVISGSMGSTVKEGTSDIISNIGGSITSEAVGNVTKGTLDEADETTKKQ
ncbi:hemagglutinin repeat-containing protein [Klebsiella aerogenes]|uniref:Hemagglutinin-related protein n=1 Tax=Klebsiella aerogenes (strain ATCC 13048 / DSM 30053 / CCUG 1429 / JCM 1235 / KCTC 2190 / NBRC 13534 / NCIMB 10102 / NCTC 10006 / CDC 819-56) TaxID=1028307 RepID=A0A0H3FMW7_KLEAK|nr:hemagglutinin repeat-containing protein [Klebsiella aerogenes]AEG96728.1 hemagglutinin-related protein [Klebsiella aerogenes KCTC 2190]MEC4756944.1 hemagglutinin repeat-containing protein [Klebsiella aerogenes]QEU20379.1 filamentous hemagglutinin N-terminal domain-containing protein [Klebsiella aerogenes]